MIAARYVSTLLGHTTASVSEVFASSIGQSVKVNIVYISSLSVALRLQLHELFTSEVFFICIIIQILTNVQLFYQMDCADIPVTTLLDHITVTAGRATNSLEYISVQVYICISNSVCNNITCFIIT